MLALRQSPPMIPLRLELTNFLSYRQATCLDFDGVHLACISGLNGAGKSSILDAITWALFGKSRSRSDDDIINRLAVRHGEAAEVRFEFELEGGHYRIIRRKQHGRPAVLDFQVSGGDERWRTLSEGGVRQTQSAIEELLRMNFDTFTNASFFLQGQADEFTMRTPGKRKEILADLLSVNLWDRYKEAAAARRKQEQDRLLLLDARLQEIDLELQEQEQREADLQVARDELAQLSERLREREQLLEQMRRVEAATKQQEQQVQNLRESLARASAALQRLQQSEGLRHQELAQHETLLAQEEGIAAAHEQWQEAQQALEGWQEKADAFNRLQRERRPHELALERARSSLQQHIRALQQRGEQIAAMSAEQAQLAQTLARARQKEQELQEQREHLAANEEAWHEARAALQQLEGARQMQQQELQRLQQQASRITQLGQEQGAVRQNLVQAAEALAQAEQALTDVQRQHERLMQAMADRDNLQAAQTQLRAEMDKLAERKERLQADTGGDCPLCGQELTPTHRAQVLAQVQAEGEQHAAQFRHNRQALAALAEEIETLEKAVKERERWQRELQSQQQRQATAQARLEEIARALAEWQEEGAGRLAALQQQLKDNSALEEQRAVVARLHADVQKKGQLEAALRETQQQISNAEARGVEIERATSEWEQSQKGELAAAQERLAQDEIAPEARAALAALDKQLAALGYDEALHTAARAARAALREAPQRYQELKQAQAAVKPLQDTLSDLQQQIAENGDNVARLQAQHDEAQAQLEALGGDGGDLAQMEKDANAMREQEIAAQRRVGAAQQRLAVLDRLREQREQERERRATLTRLIERLLKLEKACGRDGVQALLIEQALPEIEEDANELLERLTGGEMRVMFETQRELKSRDALAETLDIRISDGAGERPYENFSGGEQFRVNFAVRLALSRILAKRAGARLQTLVIDEGFGSQDPQGRQRLVEAINTIQQDFARVLVITHVDELRDAFPTRIEVEKGAGGSRLVVV